MMAWLNISPIRTANFGLSPIHNEICFIKWNKMAPQFPALRLGEISPNRTTVYNIKINLSRIFALIVMLTVYHASNFLFCHFGIHSIVHPFPYRPALLSNYCFRIISLYSVAPPTTATQTIKLHKNQFIA